MSPAGVVLDAPARTISDSSSLWGGHIGLAFGAGEYLVVWADGRSGPYSSDPYAARVAPMPLAQASATCFACLLGF